MAIQNKIEKGNVIVCKKKYAVIKAFEPELDTFATIIDRKEITLVKDQKELNEKNIIAIEKEWKLLTFDMVLAFEVVGFLAAIAQELAKVGVSIFVISSYSTDHLFVKEKDLGETIETLSLLGYQVSKN